jgi:hypothetical protein
MLQTSNAYFNFLTTLTRPCVKFPHVVQSPLPALIYTYPFLIVVLER